MAGIEQAQKGLLGLSAASIALAAATAIVIKVGRDGIDNFKKSEEAANQLSQAYATQKDTLEAHRAEIEKFIATNAAFISDQYDTEVALAQVIRAGYDEAQAMRILGDALDYMGTQGGTASEASTALIKILAGNTKALRVLGITLEQYNKIMKDKTIPIEERRAKLLDLIESKINKGRETTDAATQSQNKLTIAYQNFTSRTGPSLLVVWNKINEAMATGLDILSVYADLILKITGPGGLVQKAIHAQAGLPAIHGRPGVAHRASGGPVTPGSAYTVGEQGPETLVMGSQGGTIIPHGSGSGRAPEIHIHIDRGAYIDGPGIDILTNRIAQRLSLVTGH